MQLVGNGRVLDNQMNPISGATVHALATGRGGPRTVGSGASDTSGMFSFTIDSDKLDSGARGAAVFFEVRVSDNLIGRSEGTPISALGDRECRIVCDVLVGLSQVSVHAVDAVGAPNEQLPSLIQGLGGGSSGGSLPDLSDFVTFVSLEAIEGAALGVAKQLADIQLQLIDLRFP